MRPLTFPAVDRPALSMIMVTYGGWKWVREALGALIEHTEPCYEVIVVDNASPDETPDRLRDEVEGAKVLFNPGNLGFAAGVNRGVCHATAPFLGLLNSDAMVQPGWLPPLLEGLESIPDDRAEVWTPEHPFGRMIRRLPEHDLHHAEAIRDWRQAHRL